MSVKPKNRPLKVDGSVF